MTNPQYNPYTQCPLCGQVVFVVPGRNTLQIADDHTAAVGIEEHDMLGVHYVNKKPCPASGAIVTQEHDLASTEDGPI